MKIEAAMVSKAQQPLEITELNLDEIKNNEVLIKISASGVCHTDAVGRDGGTTPLPLVLGHEGSGIVEKTGANVTNVHPGDHVVLSFSYCGKCRNCLAGHPEMCEHFNELNFGGKNFDGTHRLHTASDQDVNVFFGQSSFATYAVADQHSVVKVDPEVDINLLGPLGCGIQTGAGTVLNYLKPQPADSLAIFGAGGVGLAAAMGAKIAGVKQIIVIDRNVNRLAIAKELGATDVVNTDNVPLDKLCDEFPDGVKYAIDTTGSSLLIKTAIKLLQPAGECVAVGIGGKLELDLMSDLLLESKKLSGMVEGDSQPQKFIPQLVQYYKEGKFPFDKLVRFYDFQEINQAFAGSKSGAVIKPIVLINAQQK
ncbi:NAD(P)-dependent alcohol dehydrogenase [Limosilactobacillus kribbianus]|uniref:NAD(P)-dependent alcohol dehydrogenase n=1 Tax=Limosilactobacillus kribbianus TaxID=2982695 RepID=UPI0022646F1D|nr:NAD(P)-dependent alcohol dehydrogenase [Limosilactobacillus kribbianus]